MENNKLQKTTGTALNVKEKNITDKVLNSITCMEQEQGLVLPKNYNPSNALKAAYLKLADSNLLDTDQTALAQALLNMCIQALNPAKNQCYFINYAGKVNLMRSYHGDRAACITSGLVKDIPAYVIYKGDNVDITYTEDGYMKVEHKTSWENFNNEIVGAYAVAILPDGRKMYDIMTIDRIKKSWSMSKNYGDKNKLQNVFDDDACKRTVIRHLVKNIFNSSTDDNLMVDSFCETTRQEYRDDVVDSKEFANTSVEEVKEEQVEQMASKKPPVQEEVVEASNTNFEAPSEDNIDTSDFDI